MAKDSFVAEVIFKYNIKIEEKLEFQTWLVWSAWSLDDFFKYFETNTNKSNLLVSLCYTNHNDSIKDPVHETFVKCQRET